MNQNRHPLLWLLLALLCAIAPRTADAQLLYPEVIVDTQRLPEEARTKLTGLDSTLRVFLENQEWARDDYQYDFPVQISIFFTDYTPDPQEDRYKAKLIATNLGDVRLEDTRWEFGLRPPFAFRSGTFEPFKSVVEFYVWLLVAMEYDRLEKLGGQMYFDRARQIYLESSGSIYYFGWDRRIDLLRSLVDDHNQSARELNFFFYTGIYYDEKGDLAAAKDYLYYALVKLDKVPSGTRERFLESNHRQFAEALVRAGYPKGVKALIQMDPGRRDVYESIAPEGGN